MTENEAISRIKDHMEIHRLKEPRAIYITVALSMAITALKEIQQYRKIGTVEEIKDLLATISEAAEDVDESGISVGFVKDLIQLKKYREIGTVEECREAVEKQKPKKPHRNYKKFSGLWCKCGWYLGQKQCLDIKYCPNCGQAIDDNLEGMEDEEN